MTSELTALQGYVTNIVAAYVSHNSLPPGDLPKLLAAVHAELVQLSSGIDPSPAIEPKPPAVPIRKSVTPNYLVCLEDGRKFRTLRRYLMTRYGLSPDQYREKWNLPGDYPMVAPTYAALRSQLAKQAGLGQPGRTKTATPPVAVPNRAAGRTLRSTGAR